MGQAIEADFEVATEILQLRETPDRSPFIEILREGEVVKVEVDKPANKRHADLIYPFDFEDFAEYITKSVRKTDLLSTDLTINPVFRHFSETMARTRLYQLVPLEGRRPGVPTPNADLARHGENLPALVAFMKRQNPEAWSRILEAMRRIVPGLEDVKTEFTPDRRLALQFAEEGVRRPWSAEDISDGTIQGLALFSTLFDPRSPLLLIEEPENSVHPWVIRSFIDACREVKNKQILITTHSPALINYLAPDEVTLIWRRDGRTQVKPLVAMDQGARGLWESGRATVFELLDSGRLPEAVPGEVE